MRRAPPDRWLDDYRSLNALAESFFASLETELIARAGPWRTLEQVELATAGWVDFWNTTRLHGACGDVPPAEYETAYHQRRQATKCGRLKSHQPSLHESQSGSE